MQRRQQILIAAVAMMLVAYAADQAYRRLYATPLQQAQRQSETLRKQLRGCKLDVRREQKKLRELDDLQQRSLPSDLEMAVSCYRTWLLQLIETAALQGTSVNSGQPIPQRNLYYRLDFTVRGSGTLQQITDFLFQFYQAGYLHKIRSVTLSPSPGGQVGVSVTIETLVLPTAKYTDQLASITPDQQPGHSLDDYRLIARRNLFAGGDPVSAGTVLTAITSDAHGRPQAWFSVRPTGQTHILTVGDSISIDSLVLRVLQITADRVEAEVDGQPRVALIGMTLADAPPLVAQTQNQPQD